MPRHAHTPRPLDLNLPWGEFEVCRGTLPDGRTIKVLVLPHEDRFQIVDVAADMAITRPSGNSPRRDLYGPDTPFKAVPRLPGGECPYFPDTVTTAERIADANRVLEKGRDAAWAELFGRLRELEAIVEGRREYVAHNG